ncbi:uncharacterized protein TRIADDRAFT_37000 [Trichoplax adhaerens]|uniref:Uncharacterized protein n=1 Tax=Trichoplax adhaerens TaxID=10228 RepID=B3RHY0_TRIAD|nr:hypothetical protein TRIADDRAFT_37000 [Trichoplax adhaerens]EDV28940.1 hypothetical protein TRIADDRAFT_37000 [Trichoplax adhaerens]|eukprot:XP_002108142.1 hypothetical protein TRIADDRAFT_37000 [Trichoplax adhaerens]
MIGCLILLLFLCVTVPLLAAVVNNISKPSKVPHLNGNTSSQIDNAPFPYQNPRLPKHIVPLFYIMKLNIQFDKLITDGQVNITLHVTKPTNFIVFHHVLIDIQLVNIYQSRLPTIKPIRIDGKQYNSSLQMFYIKLSSNLAVHTNYTLSIKFTSKVFTDRLKGLYLNNYTDIHGRHRHLAITQFESVFARLAFPCFDEPGFKTPYKIYIARPKNFHVLSNMPTITERSLTSQIVEAEFATTPPLSSYLIAYVIGNLAHLEIKSNSNITLRIWCSPNMLNYTKLAINHAKIVVAQFENLFHMKLNSSKLDMVLAPNYLSGGMENWGLITYPESSAIYMPVENQQRQTVISTVTHEIAHQWFGNIVTIKWWNELWVKEGFATLMEFVSEYKLTTMKQAMASFFQSNHLAALKEDSFFASHALSMPISTLEKIKANYDSIEYAKGACILQMLLFFLGEKTFLQGTEHYLYKWKSKTASNLDLWKSFDKVRKYMLSENPISATMILHYKDSKELIIIYN